MPTSKRQLLLSKYVEANEADGYGDEYQNHPSSNTVNTESFRTSVIRHPADKNNKLYKSLSDRDLNDILTNLNISTQQQYTRKRSANLSTVHESDQDDEDFDFDFDEDDRDIEEDVNPVATLTQENIEKFNESMHELQPHQPLYETLKASNNNSKGHNPLLSKYMEENDDFEEFDDMMFTQRINEVKKHNKSPVNQGQQQQSKNESRRAKNGKLYETYSMPLSKNSIVPATNHSSMYRSESLHSISSGSSHHVGSSRRPSSYGESELTDHSDYAEYFDNFDDSDDNGGNNELNLMLKFQERQRQAERKVELNKTLKSKQFESIRRSQLKRQKSQNHRPMNYFEYDHSAMMDDFEDFGELDSRKLYKYKIMDPSQNNRLAKKTSMPTLMKSASSNHVSSLGSPGARRAIRKFSSTMALPRYSLNDDPFIDPVPYSQQQQLPQPKGNTSITRKKSYYEGTELEGIDDLPTSPSNGQTMTLSDYKKLQKKSRMVDLSKYAEAESAKHHHHHHHHHHVHYQTPKNGCNSKTGGSSNGLVTPSTNNSRLSKEGKLKMIKSMGKHKSRQVMAGHKYGEMVFDPDQLKWCGNEEELGRFEVTQKPGLIKKKSVTLPEQQQQQQQPIKGIVPSASNKNLQIVGNMVYDNEKLRWVSLSGKYEDDPFENMDDTIQDIPKSPPKMNNQQYQRNQSMARSRSYNNIPGKRSSGPSNRGVSSTSTVLTSSTASSNAESDNLSQDQFQNETSYFDITIDQYKLWKNEESRWTRKVGNWFPNDGDDFEFCYELKTFLNKN